MRSCSQHYRKVSGELQASNFHLGKEAPDRHQINPRTSMDPVYKRKIFCPSQESNPDSSVIQATVHFLHQLRYLNAIEHWILVNMSI